MIKGTGVDIIEIARVKKAVEASDRFLPRIFRPEELEHLSGANSRWPFLAARFAAKEAAAKAIGTGIGRVKWTDIEVACERTGRPFIRLYGAAKEAAARLGVSELALSVSHSREYAVAFVVAY